MPTTICYAMVRIETDKSVKDILDSITKLELSVSPQTLIDICQQAVVSKDSDFDNGPPVIYFP